MAGCNSACCPSWPDHSLAFAQQTNLPGHAGWLLRAGHCSLGAHSCHCLAMPNPTAPLCPRHLPPLQTMCQGLPLLLRQFLPTSTPHLPEAPTLPQPTFHRFIQTWYSCISTEKPNKTKKPTKQNLSKDSTRPDKLASTKHQHDTSDTPAAMQALKSNPEQNCTPFPGDWECTGFEERHPLISPGSSSHTSHGAHLTSALPYFILQL